MYVGFSPSKSKPLVEAATAARTLRQQLIAGNIANIDTPFYKARDLDFETTLRKEAAKIYQKSPAEPKLELAQTNEKHFAALDFPSVQKPVIFHRSGHAARNDANTVDLDVETTEMGKNTLMLQALDTASKKYGAIFKSVIDSSAKI